MRYLFVSLAILLGSMNAGHAQTSADPWLASKSIGIHLSAYPQLILVPDLPVYYAPRLNYNLFFHDGSFWVYKGEHWYSSTWYNGPWLKATRDVVPVYVLRIPVDYYRVRPEHFRGWQVDAAPRWGEHWGREWERSRAGWDRWDRSTAPAPAPVPFYQRRYAGESYPQLEQQAELVRRHYPYQSQGSMGLQDDKKQAVQTVSAQPAGASAPGKAAAQQAPLHENAVPREPRGRLMEARAW